MDYILDQAKKAAGGTPATGVDEVKWLNAFLTARYNLLYNWDSVARASVKRITMYQDLVKMGEELVLAQGACWTPPWLSYNCFVLHLPAGNLNLDGPIYVDLEQHTALNGAKVWQIKDVYYGEHWSWDAAWGAHMF